MSKTYSAGIVTAYGAAKRAGYQGTYEDFCRQQAQYAQNASAIEQAKQTAVSASQSANQAKQDAQTASTTAQQSAQSAQGSAQSAGQSAQDAQTAKNNAQTYAQSASQSAGSAQQSAQSAQAVLESIPEDYSDLSEDVDKLKAELSDLITIKSSTNDCDPNTFTTGLLNASGIVDTSYTTRKTTDYIRVVGEYVSVYCHQDGYADIGPVRIAFYNSDKTLDRIIKTSPAIVLPVNEASFVRVSFAENWTYYFVGFSDTNIKVPFEEYYPNVSEIKESALPSRIIATDNWLYKFAECDFVGGNVHLSVDDVGYALYDLTSNNPASLWDNTFFGQLKTLHDTYGICVTCNCFSFLTDYPNYDIADVPNTWANEFVGAKDWLKFSFHAKNNTINYSSATSLAEDYAYFVNAIYAMTGDYDCIDTGVRLTMFSGSKDQITSAMALNYGITMLWSADDNRDSYYFDSSQTERVNSRGKYIDDLTNLLFVKSMPRLDNHNIDDITTLLSAKPQYGKMVELYCHENLSGIIAPGTITRINNALSWFNANNYKSHFLTEIFK